MTGHVVMMISDNEFYTWNCKAFLSINLGSQIPVNQTKILQSL